MNPKKMQYKSKKRVKKVPGKTEIYLIAAIAIIFVISISIYRYMLNNYNYLKQDITKQLIYTSFTNNASKYIKEVPYVNIKTENIKTINSEISQFSNKYLNIEKSVLTYEYELNGVILSIILKASNFSNNNIPEVEFISYNINLDTKTIVDNDTLFSYYGIDLNYVNNKLEHKFKSYYQELVKEGYFSSRECNYKCFLNTRGIEKYTKDVSYFIKDGKLYAYKPFYIISIYGEENFFKEENFIFEIS